MIQRNSKYIHNQDWNNINYNLINGNNSYLIAKFLPEVLPDVSSINLNKLIGWELYWLLIFQPQFYEYCNWSKLSDGNWYWLLKAHPQFEKYRNA